MKEVLFCPPCLAQTKPGARLVVCPQSVPAGGVGWGGGEKGRGGGGGGMGKGNYRRWCGIAVLTWMLYARKETDLIQGISNLALRWQEVVVGG